jgi:hypothetical protein
VSGCRHTIVAFACLVAATVSWAGAAELDEIQYTQLNDII